MNLGQVDDNINIGQDDISIKSGKSKRRTNSFTKLPPKS